MNEQHLEECVRLMGPDLGPFQFHLDQEVDSLRIKWCEFHALFQDDAEGLDLLNQSASTFFYMVQKIMYEDAMLHLSRLTDPGRQFGHENLSIRRLPDLIDDAGLRIQVAQATDRALASCAFAREWRDKRLAHSDASIITGRQTIAYPDVQRDDVDAGIESIRIVVRLVSAHHGAFSFSASAPGPNPWGAKALVRQLRKSAKPRGGRVLVNEQ
jgi:hypothetical protein